MLERVLERECRPHIVARGEAAIDVAGADAQLQHHRRVGRLRQLEALLHRVDDRRQVRARVEQPDLRLHREGVAALLHDRGAFAVILADDDERAAGDAAGGEIGERVGGDIGADRRLEGRGAAQRIVDRGGERGGGRGLVGARLEADAELLQHVVGVGQHVDQMRDRRALIAGDIGHAGLQQRLGDGEDAFAAEFLAGAELELFDFFLERAFRHDASSCGRCRGAIDLALPPPQLYSKEYIADRLSRHCGREQSCVQTLDRGLGGLVLRGIAAASAQEVTLRAVSSFAEGTQFSKNFERFIEKVNKDGKGVIQINYIGGPRAMPPFEVGNAVRTRVVDIANVTGAFYTNLMPEADGFKLIGKPMSEQRKNGTWDYINQLHNQKLNSQYLARQFHNVPFHIYLNKKIDKIDFSGLKIRVTPVYRDIVEALGGTPITTAPGEVYTALERGVVDGYGWPVTGIFDLGWDKVTKFRMEPAFYSVEVNVLVNLDDWKGLNDAQRKVLNDAALWLEGLDSEKVAAIKAERERQAKAGIQALDFGPAASKAFLDKANDVGLAVGDQACAGERPEAARSWRGIDARARIFPIERRRASVDPRHCRVMRAHRLHPNLAHGRASMPARGLDASR